ncbi:type IX secretion system outer membrane channel protein PorV [Flavobacterium salilacus subsp. salilacus]|uniref:type IX secretion system outer membrane channel protein PorV n=1 Tax=Flavobacterium TaxID=237 RepID=UPI0010756E8F|nr:MULTISPECIES: type IX secretion system outer membrane channel protein PorV [Flavobacterium]KAF2519623.1 type IX secretion system outer membrane channel protein PorV [Flavobacterium salilacus subsp. salilacus]MBE1614475.1 type IX secretion system outer membrane channel protein PorV [Flavobacterium sp. SaA2.13]
MKKIILFTLSVLGVQVSVAQVTQQPYTIEQSNASSRAITTGVPFLLIAADARAAGMADQGVATSTDTYSQQWNPAKYAFALDGQGVGISYTPYLTEIAGDISLAQVNYYRRYNERSAFAGSFRYFGLGDIELRQTPDDPGVIRTPNELAVDLSYSLKLSERFAMAVAGRFISSNLRIPEASGGGDATAANTFAFDVAGFYQSEEVAYTDFNGRWRAGFNFQNMGPKINYNNDEDTNSTNSNYLPANLRLGGGFDFIFDEFNKVAVNVEVTKLLVPTPPAKYDAIARPSSDTNGDGIINGEDTISEADYGIADEKQAEFDEQYSQDLLDYNKTSWVSGIFESFGDAPDGFREELKEVTYSLGAEYTYQDSFAFRLGYFNEDDSKGARKFFSLGAGFKYTVVKIDVSYLFSASQVRNPLENTLRFSLTFNFGDTTYDEY